MDRRHPPRRLALVPLAALAPCVASFPSFGCSGTSDPSLSDPVIADESAPVVGIPDRGFDPAVVALTNARGELCSGVLLASDVVLTARRCVTAVAPTLACGGATENREAAPSTIRVDARVPQPGARWASTAVGLLAPDATDLCGSDIALVVLASPLSGLPPTAASPSGISLGSHVRTVGFGELPGPAGAVSDVLREHVAVVAVSGNEFAVAEAGRIVGPGAAAFDESSGAVVGVLSRGDGDAVDVYTRVDAFYGLVDQALAWGPALAADADAGASFDAGRRRDAGRAKKPPTDIGAACGAADQCGAGVCVTVQDAEYCSRACSPSDKCPTGYKCLLAAGGGSVCARP